VKLPEEPSIVVGKRFVSQYGRMPHTLWGILCMHYQVGGHVDLKGQTLLGSPNYLSSQG